MLNHLTIMGRLVADPELRYINENASVCNIRIACQRDYTNQEGERDADFISAEFWNRRAKFVYDYFRKGQLIIISGRIQSSNYEDREGNKRTKIYIKGEEVYFGESKRAGDYDDYDREYSSSHHNRVIDRKESYNPKLDSGSEFEELGGAFDDNELPF